MIHPLVGMTPVSDILRDSPENILLEPGITSSYRPSGLTFLHVAHSRAPQLLVVLGRLVQVQEDVYARSKQDHVLISTDKRHLNQGVQVADGQGQNIACD